MGGRNQRYLNSGVSFKSATKASIPLIGNIFLLLIVIVLAGAVAVGAFGVFSPGNTFGNCLEPAGANIEIELVEGGFTNFGPNSERARFEQNRIVMVHGAGTSLGLETTSIKITGYGNSYRGTVENGDQPVKGEMLVFYSDLTPRGKNPEYLTHNGQTLDDGYWSIGEKLILFGRDSTEANAYSSVSVCVDEIKNTSDNYGFKAKSEITVIVIDTGRHLQLAEDTAIVKVVN